MTGRRKRTGRYGLYIFACIWLLLVLPLSAVAAPYAAMVMDARNGEVIHEHKADTRLHPASLTKMMTLYIAFEAVENGEISWDTLVTVSQKAAAEPPSELGLRAGQKIKLRYLARAAAVKSANDAATAIGEAISGSEAAFARRMNRTATALGMTRTTFKNAHGLTQEGHLSTARDMTILGRHLLFDYPEYYNMFSRTSDHAGIATVYHTNRRFLADYRGADGIKTGYTRAAGFNLTASAARGNERIIATIFGGNSTASRNAKMAELLDLGFSRAPDRVAVRTPSKPPYLGNSGDVLVAHNTDPTPGTRAQAVRMANASVTRSLRPLARPLPDAAVAPVIAALEAESSATVEPAEAVALAAEASDSAETVAAAAVDTPVEALPETVAEAVTDDVAPDMPEPDTVAAVEDGAGEAVAEIMQVAAAIAPSEPVVLRDIPTPAMHEEVVTRLSTSGGRHWGINLGRYSSRFTAEKILLRTALSETGTLDGALRKVVRGNQGFDATFHGMSRETAELACRRLQARQMTCFMVGPPG